MSRDHEILSVESLRQIDQICQEFESLWRSGTVPRIEDYLGNAPLSVRTRLLQELLLLDLHYRTRRGEGTIQAEYEARFPQDLSTIDSVFQQLVTKGVEGARTRSGVNREVPAEFAGYEVLEVIGEGGMGVVYRARQPELGRIVALKVIRPELFDVLGSERHVELLDRFRVEAQAAARLEHENIVPVYEVGQCNGRPFYSMRCIDGPSLEKRLRSGPLEGLEAANMLESVARAIHCAHVHEILHRDIKPRNILLDKGHHPYVSDFGLAKAIGSNSDLTRSGEILGTVSYMSPEQARGELDLDARSDIYGLGATLYELITGRAPFRAASMAETLHQVIHDEPVPPRQLNPAIDRDLETICLKCLQKERRRRYVSAEELADEFQRYCHGQPIHARPISAPSRAWRWCKRKPLVAGLGAAVAFLMLFVTVASPLVIMRQTALRKEADNRAEEARSAQQDMEVTLVDMYTSAGLVAAERNQPDQAVLWFANAARLASSDPNRQRANRIRVRTWSRLVPMPVCALEHDGQQLRSMQFHAEGRHLLTLTKQDQCTIWDLASERRVPLPGGDRPVRSVTWSPDGKWLAFGMPEGDVELYSFPANELLRRIEHHGAVEALAFSRDGKRLAVASDLVKVWDCENQRAITPDLIHPRPVFALAFSDSGDRLATGCADHRARVFAIKGRSAPADALFPPVRHVLRTWEWCMPIVPSFIDQDRGLLTATDAYSVAWRDAESGQQIQSLPTEAEAIHFIVVSPDRQRFALGGCERTSIWDVATKRPVGKLPIQPGHVLSASFSPDGATLIAGSLHALQSWSTLDGQLAGPVIRHEAQILQTAFSPRGRCFATAQVFGLVHVWQTATGDRPDRRLPLDGISSAVKLSRDGRYLIPTGSSWYGSSLASTRVYDTDRLEPAGPPLRPGGILIDAELSPDARLAITLSTLRQARFWDWRTGQQLCDPLALPSEPREIQFTPDGRRAFVACLGGHVLAIDPANGQVVMRLQHGTTQNTRNVGRIQGDGFLDISPDGRKFLTCSIDQYIRVCDTTSGELCFDPLEHERIARLGRFSSDARLLLTSEDVPESRVQIWDAATGAPLGRTLQHSSSKISDARFSPDSRQVLTASTDGMARLWDWRTGKLLCPPFQHEAEVLAASFTPDGIFVLSSDHDFTARVWEWHTGKPVTPWLPLSNNGCVVITSPDGGRAFVGGSASCIDVFELDSLYREDELELDDLCVLGEILSGQEIHEGGDVVHLSSDEWLDRWYRLRKRHPEYLRFQSPRDEIIAWHRKKADKHLDAGQWFAAAWHISRLIAHEPENWQHYRDRGHAYAALGQIDKAHADYAETFALVPSDEARSYLRDQVAALRRIDRQEHQRILADINGYLAAQSARGLEDSELALAAQAAHSLELRGNTELAVRAYQGFADLIDRSQDASFTGLAKRMRGAVRRISLVGNEFEYLECGRDGSPFSGTSCQGKVVLVQFWSSRYANWQQEFINLKKLYQLYNKRGFEIVSVNVNRGRPPASLLPDDTLAPWIVLQADASGRSHPMVLHYGIWSVPTNFIVGRDGKVLSTQARSRELKLWLQRLLGPPYVPRGKLAYVDLQCKANHRLDQALFNDGNHLGELPQGEQTLGGISFRIDERLIQLGSTNLIKWPRRVTGITVNQNCTSLYILHATHWGGGEGPTYDHDVIGEYHVKYDDATEQGIAIVYGEDVRDAWWSSDRWEPVSRGVVVWEGRNEAVRSKNLMLRLYVTQWTNPHPEKKVATLDFVSTNTGPAPYCVAITLESLPVADTDDRDAVSQ